MSAAGASGSCIHDATRFVFRGAQTPGGLAYSPRQPPIQIPGTRPALAPPVISACAPANSARGAAEDRIQLFCKLPRAGIVWAAEDLDCFVSPGQGEAGGALH
eukprot:5912925-Prymnesium_polylepis.1